MRDQPSYVGCSLEDPPEAHQSLGCAATIVEGPAGFEHTMQLPLSPCDSEGLHNNGKGSGRWLSGSSILYTAGGPAWGLWIAGHENCSETQSSTQEEWGAAPLPLLGGVFVGPSAQSGAAL